MRTVARILSTTLTGAALAGLACVAGTGAAHAAPARTADAVVTPTTTQATADGEMRAESTRRFTLSNLSEKRLWVASVVTTWADDPTPEGVALDTPDTNPSRVALAVPRFRPMTAAETDEPGTVCT